MKKETEKAKQERNNSVIIKSKYQLQSYILTTAKYDFNVYEKRILYKLVERAQSQIEGLQFRNGKDLCKIEHQLFGLIDITMPIAPLLKGEKDENYSRIKNALRSLSKKSFEYEDSEIWTSISIIAFPDIKKNASTVSFTIHPKIWDCCLDFSKGFTKYNLVQAMTFKSVYTMRFYELMYNQKYPISYSLEQLKEMFKLTNKYKQVNDFIRKVIEPAKKELDSCSPYSFSYTTITKKSARRPTITGFTFTPIYQPQYEHDEDISQNNRKQLPINWNITPQLSDYLIRSIGFTKEELKRHIYMWAEAEQTLPDVLLTLSDLRDKSYDKRNPKGWIIKSIQGKIDDFRIKQENSTLF